MRRGNGLAAALIAANIGIWGTLPASAHAADAIGAATVAQTDAYIAAHLPTVVDHCKGTTVVTFDATANDGEAHGWKLSADGRSYDWDPTACKISLRPGLPEDALRRAYLHERLHFVVGPDHIGILAPPVQYPAWTDCQEDEPCWIWSQMGNLKRAGVYLKGQARPKRVSANTFRKMRILKRIDWKRTKRLKGDFIA